jgi:hypothetical protein
MKKFFGLSFIVFCFVLAFTGCLNPVGDASGGDTTGDTTDKIPGTTVEFKPGPLAFAFIDSGLVVNYTNHPGDRVGTFVAQGGSGSYTYALVEGRGATDNALFEIAEDPDAEGSFALFIAGDTDLDWGNYSVRVRLRDGGNATYEQACAMEVILTPEPVSKAPLLFPHIIDLQRKYQ